jgi:hypothetical protein
MVNRAQPQEHGKRASMRISYRKNFLERESECFQYGATRFPIHWTSRYAVQGSIDSPQSPKRFRKSKRDFQAVCQRFLGPQSSPSECRTARREHSRSALNISSRRGYSRLAVVIGCTQKSNSSKSINPEISIYVQNYRNHANLIGPGPCGNGIHPTGSVSQERWTGYDAPSG